MPNQVEGLMENELDDSPPFETGEEEEVGASDDGDVLEETDGYVTDDDEEGFTDGEEPAAAEEEQVDYEARIHELQTSYDNEFGSLAPADHAQAAPDFPSSQAPVSFEDSPDLWAEQFKQQLGPIVRREVSQAVAPVVQPQRVAAAVEAYVAKNAKAADYKDDVIRMILALPGDLNIAEAMPLLFTQVRGQRAEIDLIKAEQRGYQKALKEHGLKETAKKALSGAMTRPKLSRPGSGGVQRRHASVTPAIAAEARALKVPAQQLADDYAAAGVKI